MKQYCRYCAYAIDYDGLICEADAPCGNHGAGKQYGIEKAKRPNKCPHFVFNSNDLLGQNPDGSFRQYQPRPEKQPADINQYQMDLSFLGE